MCIYLTYTHLCLYYIDEYTSPYTYIDIDNRMIFSSKFSNIVDLMNLCNSYQFAMSMELFKCACFKVHTKKPSVDGSICAVNLLKDSLLNLGKCSE